MNTCTLNPAIPVNTFKTAFQTYANTNGLKQKLDGQKIELSIDKIPNVFVLNDRSHSIWLVYLYSWDQITFRPQETDMVVSYKISKNNEVTKEGTITIANSDKIAKLKFFQSIKVATAQYLDQYNESIKAMTKKVADQLAAEI